MTTKFDNLYKQIISEATDDDSQLPEFGSQQQGGPSDTQSQPGDPAQTDQSADLGLDDLQMDKPVPAEELVLGKLAVRALNFNSKTNDVNQYKLRISDGNTIPFEKITEYFDQTKDWRRVLKFVEWVINKYEGVNSQWAEENELKGKNILQKISMLRNKNKGNPEMLLDPQKIIEWTRIILNALVYGDSTSNLVGSDVNEQNIGDVFTQLKQNFNNNSGGLFSQELKGPANN